MKKESADRFTELDFQIIKSLTEDSRLSLNKIAGKLGTSVSTAQKHIERLEKKGVLKGYTAIVDPVKLGYAVTAVVFVQVEGGRLLDVEREIAKEGNVLAVYDITGDYDAALITKFRDNSGLNAFIKRLLSMPHIKRTVTNVAFNVVKEDFNIIQNPENKPPYSILTE
jgi:Lrp/AsnC family transcriptional regulator for asnA, asnC and gidA